MTAVLRSELLKLTTTRRTTAIFLASSMGLCLLFTLIPLLATDSVSTGSDVLDLLAAGQIAALVLLILGAVNMGGERRHGTQVATFLATPVRWRVVVAKSAAHALAGAAAGLINVVLALVCVAIFADAPWPAGGDVALLAAGTVGLTACSAVLGVAVGALLRNQAAAIAGILVFLLVIEPLLGALSGFFGTYGIGASGDAMTTPGGTADLAQGVGALVQVAWVLVLAVLGTAAVERRDVSGE